MGPTPVYGARAEKHPKNADFAIKQTNICRLSGDITKLKQLTQHVARVASVCFDHIRRLRQISRCVGQEVTTRTDYCNSLFASLPQSTLEPLQQCDEFKTARRV